MGTSCAASAWWGAWGYGHAAAWLPMALCLAPGLLMTWVSLRAWLLRTVITVRRGDITINRSIIGLGSPQRYEAAPGTTIDLEQHVAVNNHGLRKLTLLQDGRKIPMGSLLRSHGEAVFLRRLMNARLLGTTA